LSEFLQHLVNMLVLGGTYALLGIGLTLIFGIMNVVNFTHGVLYTFGAYIMFIVVNQLGLNFFLALPVAVIAGWLLGAAVELTSMVVSISEPGSRCSLAHCGSGAGWRNR